MKIFLKLLLLILPRNRTLSNAIGAFVLQKTASCVKGASKSKVVGWTNFLPMQIAPDGTSAMVSHVTRGRGGFFVRGAIPFGTTVGSP